MRQQHLIIWVATIVLAGCSFWKDQDQDKESAAMEEPSPTPEQTSPRFLGTISMVNEGGRFVLVDFGGFAAPKAGAELQVRRASAEVATIQAGSEMRRPFAAADILKGEPQPGDDVWSKKQTP